MLQTLAYQQGSRKKTDSKGKGQALNQSPQVGLFARLHTLHAHHGSKQKKQRNSSCSALSSFAADLLSDEEDVGLTHVTADISSPVVTRAPEQPNSSAPSSPSGGEEGEREAQPTQPTQAADAEGTLAQ